MSIFGDMTVYSDPARSKVINKEKSLGYNQSQTHQYSSRYNRQLDLEKINDKDKNVANTLKYKYYLLSPINKILIFLTLIGMFKNQKDTW